MHTRQVLYHIYQSPAQRSYFKKYKLVLPEDSDFSALGIACHAQQNHFTELTSLDIPAQRYMGMEMLF